MILSDLIHAAKIRLRDAGVPAFALDATILGTHAFDKTRERQLLDGHERMTADSVERFLSFIERRAAFEPVAYITGEKAFRRHVFTVSPDTLIPRPDSECLLDSAEDYFADRMNDSLRVLDICTGSGCLLLSLLAIYPNAVGIGTDISLPALRIAQRNIFRTDTAGRARFICANWAEGVRGKFDIILCNPPYIRQADKKTLARDITGYEPDSALFAGADGFDAYRAVFPALLSLLAPGGMLFTECGDEQTSELSAVAAANGLETKTVLHDLSGAPRGIVCGVYSTKNDPHV